MEERHYMGEGKDAKEDIGDGVGESKAEERGRGRVHERKRAWERKMWERERECE